MTTTMPIPEFATTVGATVYVQGRRDLTKATVSRVTKTSVFVTVTYASHVSKELRFTTDSYSSTLVLHGTRDNYYDRRTLVSEELSNRMQAADEARRAADKLQFDARRAGQAVYESLTVERAQAAIEALQAYVEANR